VYFFCSALRDLASKFNNFPRVSPFDIDGPKYSYFEPRLIKRSKEDDSLLDYFKAYATIAKDLEAVQDFKPGQRVKPLQDFVLLYNGFEEGKGGGEEEPNKKDEEKEKKETKENKDNTKEDEEKERIRILQRVRCIHVYTIHCFVLKLLRIWDLTLLKEMKIDLSL